ncbi:MAG: tripartite tricarboxylate transporter TctB family protein [Planctomycetota bacterium]|nr:tripartite tricarboxylate transporter TctB family protein [Planctomycetota bacterium]
MKRGNLAAAAAFAALAVFVIWASRAFPGSRGTVPGPAVFPTAIAVIMLMASLSLAIASFRMRPEDNKPLGLFREERRRVYLCMGIMAVYVVLVQIVGFCVTSVLLLFGLISWFGKYRFHVSALSSIAIVGIVYFVFSEVLHVPFRFGFLM